MATFAPQIEQYRLLAAKYFPNNTDLVLAIMSLEDPSGNPNAHNTSGEDSRGLMQINVGPGANTDLRGMDLFNPEQNMQAARIVYDRARSFTPWSTYSGALALLQRLGGSVGAGNNPVTPGMPEPGAPAGPAPVPIPTAPALTPPTVSPDLGSIASALQQLLQQITNIPTSIWNTSTAWLTGTATFLAWLGQVHVWERLGLVALGGLLVVVGLVLFALSFLPRSTPIPVPV